MYRNDQPTNSGTLTVGSAGTEGYFTGGNPPTTPATVFGPDWCNIITEELRNIVTTAAMTPAKATLNQVVTAILILIGLNTWTPNYFIDPWCEILQGAASVNLSTSRQFGGADLVQAWASGGAVSAGTIVQDATGIFGGTRPTYSVKVSGASLTGSGAISFRRTLEARDSSKLDQIIVGTSTKATFGVLVYQDTGSTITGTITLNYAGSTNNFGSVTNIATSSSFNIPTGTVTPLTLSSSLGAAANFGATGFEMIVTLNCGAVVTKDFYISGWSAQPTNSVLPYEPPKFTESLMKVMRYFEKSYDYSVAPGTASNFNGSTTVVCSNANHVYLPQSFKTAKVATPGVTIYSPNSGTAAKIYDGQAVADLAANTSSVGLNAMTIQNAAVATAADAYSAHWVADARL